MGLYVVLLIGIGITQMLNFEKIKSNYARRRATTCIISGSHCEYRKFLDIHDEIKVSSMFSRNKITSEKDKKTDIHQRAADAPRSKEYFQKYENYHLEFEESFKNVNGKGVDPVDSLKNYMYVQGENRGIIPTFLCTDMTFSMYASPDEMFEVKELDGACTIRRDNGLNWYTRSVITFVLKSFSLKDDTRHTEEFF